jgi:hypothetical protein
MYYCTTCYTQGIFCGRLAGGKILQKSCCKIVAKTIIAAKLAQKNIIMTT